MMRAVPSAAPAVELLPRPVEGRVHELGAIVRLGDVDRNGRMRFDATARYMQDVATEDATEAGLDRAYGWLVRRTLIDASEPARLGEQITVATWCTGIGRSWAERRTEIVGDRGAHIGAVSLWVQIDVRTGKPARIAADFVDAYGATAAGRIVSARLALPGPPPGAPVRSWQVRRTDLDPFGHVNNAATWAFLEEAAALDGSTRIGRAELEYLLPVEADEQDPDLVVETDRAFVGAWLVTDGAVRAAARWTALDS